MKKTIKTNRKTKNKTKDEGVYPREYVKCPNCKKWIDRLQRVDMETVKLIIDYTVDDDGNGNAETTDRDECDIDENPDYECPKCFGIICGGEEEAEEFLFSRRKKNTG